MPAVLACPACRTDPLARRGDALCPACMNAAQEITPRPLWLFDSPLLRQALARVNLPAVPAIVRAACGLSQRDLAIVVGWSPAALSYYERGARDGLFDIRTALQFADAVGMPRAALLPLVFADPDVGTAGCAAARMSAEPGQHPNSLAAAAPAAAVLSPGVPRVVSGSHVRYWRACTDGLYVRVRAVGGIVLLASALQQWQRVRLALRDGAGGETGRLLLAVAGDLALCAGCTALDAGHRRLARRLYAEARRLAGSAGDDVLAVHVLADESMLFAEIASAGRSREAAGQALRLVFAAQEEGRYLPMPELHALIALRHASAAALLGDKTVFRAAIIRARNQLEQGPRNCGPPEWLRFVDDAEITAVEAQGYLKLGEVRRSVLLYRQLLASGPGISDRGRACFGAGLAAALLMQGAFGEAVAAAMEVLPTLEAGFASVRCLDQLRFVRQAAENACSAKEFRERLDAVNRALAASYGLPDEGAPQATASILALQLRTGTQASGSR